MASLRTEAMKARYKEYAANHPATDSCPLCSKMPLRTFTYWKITENQFPYDLIARDHHMVIPLRHVTENELTAEERAELSEIKATFINPKYDFIIEATPQNKSIPQHFHLHLIVAKG
jgi:hypothetical protein